MSVTRPGPNRTRPAEDTASAKTPCMTTPVPVRHCPPSAWKAAACTVALALSPAALVTTTTFLVEPVVRDFGPLCHRHRGRRCRRREHRATAPVARALEAAHGRADRRLRSDPEADRARPTAHRTEEPAVAA